MKGWRQILLALAACLLLTAPAWASEMDAGEEETLVMVEYEGTAELFQCGSLTGEFTRPDEVNLFAEDTVYQQMYNGMKNKQTNILLNGLIASGDFQSRVAACFSRVVNDHPELFYVNNEYKISYYNNGSVYFQPQYLSFTDSQVAQFDTKVEEIVKSAEQFNTSLEQMLYVHDYLVTYCGYNWEVATGNKELTSRVFSAYGVLVDRDAVCQGYALAYKLILDKLGINCSTVSSEGMNHMWNLVQLNSSWYHVDVTWDDLVPDMQGRALHSYFLLSDETVRDTTHKHTGWTASVTCTNKDFENGYIFNNVNYPIYYRDNAYYYITANSIYKTNSLDAIGESLGSLQLQYGVVWVDDTLYYVAYNYSNNNIVTGFNLNTKVSIPLGPVDFTPTAVSIFETYYDGIGLRYDSASNSIIARSATQRIDLGIFIIPEYPLEWGTDTAATKILGLTNDQKTAGVKCETTGMTLWAAYYRDGRMIGAKCYPINGTGLQLVELGAKPSSYDNMKMMLLTESYAPACEASQVD